MEKYIKKRAFHGDMTIDEHLSPKQNSEPKHSNAHYINGLSITGGLTGALGFVNLALLARPEKGYQIAEGWLYPLLASGLTFSAALGFTLGYALDLYIRSK